jgi:hypothetical protein
MFTLTDQIIRWSSDITCSDFGKINPLLFSNVPATCPHPEPVESSPHIFTFYPFQLNVNSILPSTVTPPLYSGTYMFRQEGDVPFSSPANICYMSTINNLFCSIIRIMFGKSVNFEIPLSLIFSFLVSS